jgi:hypothetical protein
VEETPESWILHLMFPRPLVFGGEEILRHVRRGLYANTRALRKARNGKA